MNQYLCNLASKMIYKNIQFNCKSESSNFYLKDIQNKIIQLQKNAKIDKDEHKELFNQVLSLCLDDHSFVVINLKSLPTLIGQEDQLESAFISYLTPVICENKLFILVAFNTKRSLIEKYLQEQHTKEEVSKVTQNFY